MTCLNLKLPPWSFQTNSWLSKFQTAMTAAFTFTEQVCRSTVLRPPELPHEFLSFAKKVSRLFHRQEFYDLLPKPLWPLRSSLALLQEVSFQRSLKSLNPNSAAKFTSNELFLKKRTFDKDNKWCKLICSGLFYFRKIKTVGIQLFCRRRLLGGGTGGRGGGTGGKS